MLILFFLVLQMAEILFFCTELYYACKIYGKLYKISTYTSTDFCMEPIFLLRSYAHISYNVVMCTFFVSHSPLPLLHLILILSWLFRSTATYFLCAPLKSPMAVLMHGAIIHCKIYGWSESCVCAIVMRVNV